MDIELKRKQREKRLVGRDTYVPPSLKEFGAVGALTQGGTGQSNEGSMTGDLTRRP